jgi:GAF domain-containing protein
LLALGVALAVGAVLALRRADAPRAREAEARERSLRQARDQQAATAEVLTAMAASPPDLQRVLDTIARNAAGVGDGLYAAVFRFDGLELRLSAYHGLSPARLGVLNRQFPRGLDDESLGGRAIRDATILQYPDALTDPGVPAWVRELARAEGFRSVVVVPLLQQGRALGALHVSRPEGGFTERQVELLRSFASQAVIAIENVRLFQELQARNRELTEALEQQTATAEILGVISGSPTDVQPVFQSIAESSVGLSGALFGSVYRFDGDLIHMVAHHNYPPAALEFSERSFPTPPSRQVFTARAILERAVVHVPDVSQDTEHRDARGLAQVVGFRSALSVPMLREGSPIGAITVWRGAVGPFSDQHVALLRTFADQAVIAIENVRLFQELQARNRELTELLEQQTATGAILRVMSGSPADIQPVLDAVAESATRLCDARDVSIALVDREVLRVVASHGELARWWPDEGVPISRGSVTGRAVVDRRAVHVHDLASEPDEEFPQGKAYQRLGGHRTNLAVPLVREGAAIGVIAIRRGEVRPFTDRQVRLLETFADQAVVAIENVRLFQELQARNRELTEALEQQTATGEILKVISGSPTDVQPVFDTIVQSALRLCDGLHSGVYQLDGDLIHLVAHSDISPEAEALMRREYPRRPSREGFVARAILERRVIHTSDVEIDPEASDWSRSRARQLGYRSFLVVPMLREGVPIGAIRVNRSEPRPFSEKEIALLRVFADQGVIAIENVRLFRELGTRNRELTEALEQQTATAEILGVISRSPTDLQPVLEAVARNASRLCGAANVSLYRVEGDLMRKVAEEGPPLTALRVGETRSVTRTTVSGRAIVDRTTIHLPDYQAAAAAREYPDVRRDTGIRTTIGIPLLRDGVAIGAFTAYRTEPRPFSDREVALLQTFADQAVIAIENVRLFTELGTRNREVTEALEQQTATAEILRAISSSPTDTQPVFDTIAERAARVCDGMYSAVLRFDGRVIDLVAHTGMTSAALEEYDRIYPLPLIGDTLAARAIREGVVVHSPDSFEDPSEFVRRIAQAAGHRSRLVVPMLRTGRAVGAIAVARSDSAGGPRPFTDKEIALLQTFADQGVIAVENVRLFRELETRTRELARSVEELQALSDVGRAVSSTLDLPTVLATIVTRAVQLSGTSGGVLYEYDGASQTFHLRASHRTEEELVEALRASPIQLGEGATGQAVARRTPVEVADILEDRQYQLGVRSILTRLGYRSILSVPLLLEQRILGALTVSRREPGSFPTETVNLLQTFATQSALAIQNARLFREIEAKGRELEVASRHKSQFLANMSHELRTPLNAILGYTELLIDGIYGELSQKAGDVMARIDRSGKHLLGLINDVLDLSKIEAGQLDLARADYSLAEVVNAVVTQVESLAAEKGLVLQAAVAPGLPAGRGDERRLAQVLLNLVGNAIKFTEVGSVRIAAHVDGDAFLVSVADTGPGIAEADRRRIFEEFQQADSSSTRKKGGTGLGLSIARRIVELHGGRIWVESTVGRGSTFGFRVPVRVERQVARV